MSHRKPSPALPHSSRSEFGHTIEQAVRALLEGKGLSHLQSNYRAARGEIDLIMRQGQRLVFVEVRYRRDGRGAESVNHAKQRRLISAAQHYLQRRPGPLPICRFDVVSVTGAPTDLQLEWIKDAFGVS